MTETNELDTKRCEVCGRPMTAEYHHDDGTDEHTGHVDQMIPTREDL